MTNPIDSLNGPGGKTAVAHPKLSKPYNKQVPMPENKTLLGDSGTKYPEIAGFSQWTEYPGKVYQAKTVDPTKFGGHAYDNGGYEKGVRDCPCGCWMSSTMSGGPCDPFGACPKNPKPEAQPQKSETQPEYEPWSLERHPAGAVWVRSKDGDSERLVTKWGCERVHVGQTDWEVYSTLMLHYDWLDNGEWKPCGYRIAQETPEPEMASSDTRELPAQQAHSEGSGEPFVTALELCRMVDGGSRDWHGHYRKMAAEVNSMHAAKLNEKDAEIAALRKEVEALRTAVDALSKRITHCRQSAFDNARNFRKSDVKNCLMKGVIRDAAKHGAILTESFLAAWADAVAGKYDQPPIP